MLEEDNDADGSTVFTPKKSNLSRIAISKNAARNSLPPNSIRQIDEQRPSYTTTALNELKYSTPSTPKDLTPPTSAQTLDLVAAKFGTDLALRTDDGLIPTSAEIEEKKARRKRLAQENEYLSLHADNPSDEEEGHEDRLEKRNKYGESRLVPEDEDLAEGFDDFVTDGRVALGRKAEREQRRKRKEDIASLIAEAEGRSGAGSEAEEDGSDDSEMERRRAYEAAQTKKGMEGLRRRGEEEQEQGDRERRARTPPRITPLPGLAGVVEGFRERVGVLRRRKEGRVRRLEEVRREKVEIGVREGEIQRLLKEAGEVYERLGVEAGGGLRVLENGGGGGIERGLETLGTTADNSRVEGM